MIRELRNLLRRVLRQGTSPGGPASPARPSASQRVVEGGIRIEYQDAAAPRAAAPASMAWQKERPGGPRTGVEGRRPDSARERLLFVGAMVSVAALGVVLVSGLVVNRRLPVATHGVWRTDAPAYADRMFELRSRRVAFVTRDSMLPVTVHVIQRVRRDPVDGGERFVVEYEEAGEVLELRFELTTGADAAIRFVNQPRMAWRRMPNARSLMPEIY